MSVTGEAQTEQVATVLTFDQLDGWADDDHTAAFDVFRSTCADLDDPDWKAVCASAQSNRRSVAAP